LVGVEILKLFDGIGLPEGALNLVIGEEMTGKHLVGSKIDMITFTGSTGAGKEVMKRASKGLKKVVLELGGMIPSLFQRRRFGKCGE